MRRKLAKAFLSIFILTGASAVISACHTVEGVGDDISGTGRAVERAF